eukprot:scaffold104647_cov28-Tisochrysis_lutea.AAC.1
MFRPHPLPTSSPSSWLLPLLAATPLVLYLDLDVGVRVCGMWDVGVYRGEQWCVPVLSGLIGQKFRPRQTRTTSYKIHGFLGLWRSCFNYSLW